MVLNTKQTTIAYRCPHCGAGVMSAVSLFALKGSMVRLKCTCGKSALEIEPAADGKIRLTVPCIICPHPHHFTVSESVFFNSELFLLPCPYSDINLVAMGEINHVKAELARTELKLMDLLEKSGVESFDALHKEAEETVSDPQVEEIVLFVVRDLDDEGKIYCKCKGHEPPAARTATAEPAESDLEVEIQPDGVHVTCRRCGATACIPCNSLIRAHDFLNIDSLTLE